jgi:hypothetical protein
VSAPTCQDRARVSELLGKRADDSISAVETRWLKTHLLSCRPCAESAAAEDPTLLFVPMSASAEGRLARERRGSSAAASAAQLQAEADRVVADVLAAVELERSKRRFGPFGAPARNRRALLAASIALAAAGLAGWLSTKGVRPAAPTTVAAKLAPAGAGAASAHSVSVPQPEAGTPAVADRPVIEDLKNPGATVYEFASASPQEPTLVFIVDRNADI